MPLTRTLAVASLAAVALTGLGPAAHARPPQSPQASSQVVLDWQRTSFATVYATTLIPIGVPYLGFTSLAMHDAAQAAGRAHASQAAAVATAAHDVLVEYFPASSVTLDAALAASLAAVPDGRAEDRGAAVGARVAHRLIASRAHDGRDDDSIVYSREAAPGVWQPPPSGSMLGAWIGYVRPLVVHRPLRVDGPDELTSSDYTDDFEEVKAYGGKTGSLRAPEETATALFFNSNSAIMVGDAVVRHLATDPLSLADTARLFAVMHTSMADALITCWRLKYEVGFWRPFQAVAGAAGDGNAATSPETGWEALLPNPPYADYVSGHGCLTAPAVETVRQLLGEDTPLVLKSIPLGTERTYATLTEIESDAFMSRIWGGLHFRDAMEDAYLIGHEAARLALRKLR